MINNKSPIFPFHHPQHFSDYGFDPQLDYFQVLEEARKHKCETTSSRSLIDNLQFKLSKPMSKDDVSKKIKKTRKRWWKNAFHFFKRKNTSQSTSSTETYRAFSGPIYFTDSKSGYSTPYHRTSTTRSSSGPLAQGDIDINVPYISLTQISMDHTHKISTSPMPIYLVT